MRALSIRQPCAELILRGIKTIEYRSRPTRIIGERFYIYGSKRAGRVAIAEALTPDPSPGGRGGFACDLPRHRAAINSTVAFFSSRSKPG
jgi:hypothetical protein